MNSSQFFSRSKPPVCRILSMEMFNDVSNPSGECERSLDICTQMLLLLDYSTYSQKTVSQTNLKKDIAMSRCFSCLHFLLIQFYSALSNLDWNKYCAFIYRDNQWEVNAGFVIIYRQSDSKECVSTCLEGHWLLAAIDHEAAHPRSKQSWHNTCIIFSQTPLRQVKQEPVNTVTGLSAIL